MSPIKRFILSAFLLCAAIAHGQVNNPSIRVVPSTPSGACTGNLPDQQVATLGTLYSCQSGTYGQIGSGGGGTPGGSTTQGQYNNAGAFAGTSAETFRTADGTLSQLANVQYLSASSEIGAQCTAAVTALGATGGLIILPNSTSLTMSTGCTGISQTVQVEGYGKLATKIHCTVAGDCFAISQNPTTNGSSGGKFSDFEIDGSGASNQVLIHGVGTGGWTFENIQFQPPLVTSGNTATCLELENNASGIFTERNYISPSVNFERQCTPGLYLHQSGSGDSSFAYNNFNVNGASQGASYLVVLDGTARIYGGLMNIALNHIGPGGGGLQFNGTSGTSGPLNPSEFCNVTAEENGSGAGEVVDVTSTGTINCTGTLMNGAGGAPALATLIGGANAANFNISGPLGAQGTATVFTSALATDINVNSSSGAIPRFEKCPNSTGCYFVIGHDLATNGDQVALGLAPFSGVGSGSNRWTIGMYGAPGLTGDISGNIVVGGPSVTLGTGSANADLIMLGSHNIRWRSDTSGHLYTFDNNASVTSLDIVASANPAIKTTSGGVWGWSSNSTGANNAVADTGLSRDSAGVVDCGNGTAADKTCALNVGKINVLAARKGTFVCTAGGTITIANANETATSDVIISLNAAGGTISTGPAMKTVTAATGFTVLCGAADTSTYNYDIFN